MPQFESLVVLLPNVSPDVEAVAADISGMTGRRLLLN